MKDVLRGRVACVLLVTAIHAAVAALAASPAFFYLNVGTARRVFGGSNGEASLFEDVRAYHEYATKIVNGEVPYRDFAVEYPIGALPFFLIPRLVASSLGAYRWAFAVEMIAIDAWLSWMVAERSERTVGRKRGLAWYTVGLASLGALPIARFDLAPAALAFAAAMAWGKGKGGLGGVTAGIGGLVKLFPIVVAAPAWFRGSRRGVLAMIGIVIVGAGAWAGLGGAGTFRSLRYHSGRGLEIESLYAGVLMMLARPMGISLAHDFNHSSVELIAPGAKGFAAVAPAIQIAAIFGVLVACQKGGQEGVPRSAGACVLGFALFGKVLSPQYLLWILPFVASLDGRGGRWGRPLFVAAGILTSLIYFWAGVGLLEFHPLAVAILNARNALLVAMFVTMIVPEPEIEGRV